MRCNLSAIAQETMHCFGTGFYPSEGKQIDIALMHEASLQSVCFLPADTKIKEILYQNGKGTIHVNNIDIVEAITKAPCHVGVLNFASAYHPGGGFFEWCPCTGRSIMLCQQPLSDTVTISKGIL